MTQSPIPTAKEMAEFRQRETSNQNEGFSDWLSRPEVQLVLEIIPRDQHRLALPLMRSAFVAGHVAGSLHGGRELMTSILSNLPKP